MGGTIARILPGLGLSLALLAVAYAAPDLLSGWLVALFPLTGLPAGLALARPLPLLLARRRSRRLGLSIYQNHPVELWSKIDTLVLAKSALLSGKPELRLLHRCGDTPLEDWLPGLAGLEKAAEDELYSLLTDQLAARDLKPAEAGAVTLLPGQGLRGRVDGHEILAGSQALFQVQGYRLDSVQRELDMARTQGLSVILVGVEGQLSGLLGIYRPINDHAEAMAELRAAGLHSVLLTGEHPATANALAQQAGIDKVLAGLLPEQQGAELAAIKAMGHRSAYVGNCRPVLEQAELSLASVSELTALRRLSQQTLARVRGNHFLALLVPLLCLGLAMSVNPAIQPFGFALLSVSLSLLALLLNSLRLA